MASVDERFEKAVAFVRNPAAPARETSQDEKLAVYALYKQATEGDVTGSQPWAVQFEARAKWDAWNSRKGLSKEAAKQAYVDLITAQNPDWESF